MNLQMAAETDYNSLQQYKASQSTGMPPKYLPLQGCIQKFQDSTCKKKFAYLGC